MIKETPSLQGGARVPVETAPMRAIGLALWGLFLCLETAMPWDASDAKRHKKGLSAKQSHQWAVVANKALKSCVDDGGSQESCEGRAIRIANAAVDKSLDSDALALVVEARIAKSEDTQRRIWGYASIAVMKNGAQLIDLQGDAIDIEDLTEGWYGYVKESGELNFQHRTPIAAHLIEAVVFTPEKLALWGLPPDALPLAAWVGYELESPDDYAVLKAMGFFMFSIDGFAEREEA